MNNKKRKVSIKKKVIISVMVITMLMSVSTEAITYIYDSNNRLVEVTYDDGSKVNYIYDEAGNIIETIVTPANIELVNISLDKDMYSMNINETTNIKVIGTYSDGSQKDITADSIFNVIDKNVITLRNGGIIFGKSCGETDINIDYLGKTCTAKIKVNDNIAPSIPVNLVGDNITENSVTLGWDSSTDNIGVLEYDIYSSDNKVGSSNGTSLVISGLEPNKEYNYKVMAKDQAGNSSDFSEEIKINTLPVVDYGYINSKINTIKGDINWDERCDLNKDGVVDTLDINMAINIYKPTAPANVISENITLDSVNLKWEASLDDKGVQEYDIYCDGVKIGISNTTSFTVSGLKADKDYSFKLLAKDGDMLESDFSNEIKIRTLCNVDYNTLISNYNTKEGDINWNEQFDLNKDGIVDIFDVVIVARNLARPTAPANVIGENITHDSITLKWEASSDDTGVKEYDIYCNGIKSGTSTTTSYTINELESNKEYSFEIKAKDIYELESDFSNEIKIKTHYDIDLESLASKYNTTIDSIDWEEKYDLNKDGIVDVYDLVILSKSL